MIQTGNANNEKKQETRLIVVTLDKKSPDGKTDGRFTKLSFTRMRWGGLFNAVRARNPDTGTDGISMILEVRNVQDKASN